MVRAPATTLGSQKQKSLQQWLNQFDADDYADACLILSSIRDVTEDEFRGGMMDLIQSRVVADPGLVGLFVETERGHRAGRAHRLFSEPRRKNRRAFGHGPPPIPSKRTVDPEVGSEGLISQILTHVRRQNKKRVALHPGPDDIRERKIRRFILVTDFIGSGNRAYRYLDAAWRVRSVRSWWSARRTKGMSFEVVAFSSTEAGHRKVEAHPTTPLVSVLEGCPTIKLAFNDPRLRDRMKELCIRYGSFSRDSHPLGYDGTGALITFAHGMPNNAPVMFHKHGPKAGKSWVSLYPQRVTACRRPGAISVSDQKAAIDAALHRRAKRKIFQSPRFLSAPPNLRDAVCVLLSLDRAPRTATAISARSRLSVERVRCALTRIHTYGWADTDCRITARGRRELERLAAPVPKSLVFETTNLYVPRTLRAPRSSR